MSNGHSSSGGALLIALLAAGASRRLGQPKQLVPMNGESLLRRQCRTALGADVGPVAAILGCHVRECERSVADLLVTTHFNSAWEEGLASSIRLAVQIAESRESSGLLILHADQYRVTAEDLQTLVRTWTQSPQSACVASYGDTIGPPVIFPQQHFGDLLALRGDSGARPVLTNLPTDQLQQVLLPNALIDLDLPQQLTALSLDVSIRRP
jgi:molybdenum cofactor cytidylyltransferase